MSETREPTVDDFLRVTRSWMTARDRVIRTRHKTEEAAILQNDGTQMAFLRELDVHGREIGGLLSGFNLPELESLRELLSSYVSKFGI